MRSWSWLALPILAAIIAMVWFAQERRGGPPHSQPCPEGQVRVPVSGYNPPGCVIPGERKP